MDSEQCRARTNEPYKWTAQGFCFRDEGGVIGDIKVLA